VNIEYLIELPTAIDFVNSCLCDTSTEIIEFKRKVVFCASIKEHRGKRGERRETEFTFVYCLAECRLFAQPHMCSSQSLYSFAKIEKCKLKKHQFRVKFCKRIEEKFEISD
jgi:hypothetical protein